jgi:nucleoside-diphosphate-sugar epimerase
VGKTFVTGGSGHVGANLLRALVDAGVEVRALVRRKDDPALAGLELERVEGDVGDPASLDLRGCDRVHHLAAFVSLRSGDEQRMFDTNVVGTRNVLLAAERAGVQRVVLCSSLGAIGRNPHGESDETFTINPFETELPYDLTKALAELEVHRACARGLDAVIVNPSGVVGPFDFKPSSVGKTILDFARRRMPAYVPGEFEFVAMRDVVAGHLLAMERGKRGESYILSGRTHSLDELLDELQVITGVPRPRLRIPSRVMRPVAHVTSAVMRTFFPSVPPRFTPETIALLELGKRVSTAKARRELGYAPTSVLAALREQADWFRRRGQITYA